MKLGWRLRRGCTVIALAFFCLLLILPWLTSPKDAVYRAIRVLGPALRRACLPPLRNDSPWGDVNIAIVSLHSVRDELYQVLLPFIYRIHELFYFLRKTISL